MGFMWGGRWWGRGKTIFRLKQAGNPLGSVRNVLERVFLAFRVASQICIAP